MNSTLLLKIMNGIQSAFHYMSLAYDRAVCHVCVKETGQNTKCSGFFKRGD